MGPSGSGPATPRARVADADLLHRTTAAPLLIQCPAAAAPGAWGSLVLDAAYQGRHHAKPLLTPPLAPPPGPAGAGRVLVRTAGRGRGQPLRSVRGAAGGPARQPGPGQGRAGRRPQEPRAGRSRVLRR